MNDDRPAPRILIVGGASGLELVIQLARATGRGRRARVMLADLRTSHVWKPRLHEIAVGLKAADDERVRYAELAAARLPIRSRHGGRAGRDRRNDAGGGPTPR